MRLLLGQLVVSRAGRDKGCRYVVVRTEGEYVYVADGLKRTCKKPKRKNVKHLSVTDQVDGRLRGQLESGKTVSNEEVRAALGRLGEPDEGVD